MTDEPSIPAVVFATVAVVVILGLAIAVTCRMQSDCERDGGTLVKGVWNEPKCVGGEK